MRSLPVSGNYGHKCNEMSSIFILEGVGVNCQHGPSWGHNSLTQGGLMQTHWEYAHANAVVQTPRP